MTKTKKNHEGVFVLHVCHLADGKFILILQIGKLKNELACACMNHCTLGEKQQPVEKNTPPLFQDISLYVILTMSFYFSVFQLHFIKQLIINRGVCVVVKW